MHSKIHIEELQSGVTDVLVQLGDLTLGQWREDDSHKGSLRLGRGAAGLDAGEDGIGGNAL